MTQFKLIIPESNCWPLNWIKIDTNGIVVIVGGNGTGKTRYGAKLDIRVARRAHRISAHRALQMPEYCQPISFKQATSEILYGRIDSEVRHKAVHRWKSKPNTLLIKDYDVLMKYLFSEDWKESFTYKKRSEECREKISPPITKLDSVKRIWESILPYRKLDIHVGKIMASIANKKSTYPGAEMSDGERVVFYLIGQALAAPQDGIIIVDEPELHLHKAIQAKLWDNIEAERPDCLFVYLTHDIDFASTRRGAKKLCFRNYDGKSWDWYEIPPDSELPEEELLGIVGSRKPVLFIEGDRSSLDYNIYRNVYPYYTVVPCGGCKDVIHSTTAFSAIKDVHRLDCIGIVDRDFKTESDIEYLAKRNVFTLPFAEIENLLSSEKVIEVMSNRYERKFDEVIEEIKNELFEILSNSKERVVSDIVGYLVEEKLKKFDRKKIGIDELKNSLKKIISETDVDGIYSEKLLEINRIIQDKDYSAALKIFSNKGIMSIVAKVLKQKKQEYEDFLVRIISSNNNKDLVDAIREIVALPNDFT